MKRSDMPPSDGQQHVDFLRLYVDRDEALRGFVRALVPSRDDARDVMQEVMIVLWRKFLRYANVDAALGNGRLQNNDEKTPHYVDDVRAHLLIGPYATHTRKRRR